jgi:hypothetical protein
VIFEFNPRTTRSGRFAFAYSLECILLSGASNPDCWQWRAVVDSLLLNTRNRLPKGRILAEKLNTRFQRSRSSFSHVNGWEVKLCRLLRVSPENSPQRPRCHLQLEGQAEQINRRRISTPISTESTTTFFSPGINCPRGNPLSLSIGNDSFLPLFDVQSPQARL